MTEPILQPFIEAASLILTPYAILFLFIGVTLGILVGATPGIGPPVGIALLLPLTIGLATWDALGMLFALYVGGLYGGAVSAIIINVPGTPGAIASTFDGYPLSKQGKARYALEISVLASSFGTVLSALLLILAAPILIFVILLFGTPEYALVAIFGLAIIPLVSQDVMSKSLMTAGFGLLLSTVGMPPMSSTPRFTLGIAELTDGLSFVPVLLGVFAISEMIKLSAYKGSISGDQPLSGGGGEGSSEETANGGRILQRIIQIYIRHPISFTKAMIVGLVIGFIPAAGGSVSNIVAYAVEKATVQNSESFGTGDIRGLIASESANSGTIAGSLVPLLAFGIPGSATSAIILGGMLMHGVRPGPGLFESDVYVSYATFLAVVVAGFLLLIVGLATVTRVSQLTKVDMTLIVPVVVILSVLGSYALDLSVLDVAQAIGFGLLSYLMIKYNYSIVAFIMGLILGPIVEANVHRALQLGDYTIFVSSGIGIILVTLTVVTLLWPPSKKIYNQYVATQK